EGFAFDVELVVSELVTNALRHAVPHLATPRPIRLRLLHHGGYVVCAVHDPSDRAPVVAEGEDLAESGRGLNLVEALSAAWGWGRASPPAARARTRLPGAPESRAARARRRPGRPHRSGQIILYARAISS